MFIESFMRPVRSAVSLGFMNRCLFPQATEKWAERVFPDLTTDKAFLRLSEVFDDVCCVSADKPVEAFIGQDEILEDKREILQNLKIKTLHFEGPNTDFHIGLSEKAIWLGGRKYTTDERKIIFYANVPIGEIFTAPDWRTVEGKIAVTMPTLINGVVARDVVLEFKKGELVSWNASEGLTQLTNLVETDDGAKRLGEIALVSLDTPLAKKELLFYEILLDEKGRGHGAIGNAYILNIADGSKLSKEELASLGVNDSLEHHDFMFTSKETRVSAKTYGGKEKIILEKGLWAI